METPAAAALGRPAVVLVHGAVVSARYYRPLLHQLAARAADLPAAAVELPGIGASRGPVPHDVEGQAELLAGWLRATGRSPAILVGNSMGAQTVVELAAQEPRLVDALVLIGPTVDAAARTPLAQLGKLLVDATVESFTQVAITCWDVVRSSPRATIRYLRASLEHAIEARLPAVDLPVLLVRGELDPLVPRRWLHRLLEVTPDGRTVEVAGGGHTCHQRRPDRIAELIVELTAASPRLRAGACREPARMPAPPSGSVPNSAT